MTVYKVGGDTRGVCTSPEDVLDKGVCKLGPVVREGLGERRQLGVFLGEVDDEFGKILGVQKQIWYQTQQTSQDENMNEITIQFYIQFSSVQLYMYIYMIQKMVISNTERSIQGNSSISYLVVERVMVVELRADLGDERQVLEARELAGRHDDGDELFKFPLKLKTRFHVN